MFKKVNVNKVKDKAVKVSKKTATNSVKGVTDVKSVISRAAKNASKSKKNNEVKKRISIFDIRDFLAPDGANPMNTNHFEINDNGINFYYRSFYVSELPKRGKFVDTFEPLFSFKNCNTTVYINPISTNEAIKSLDNDLTTIEAEIMTAEEKRDTNRRRKLSNKYSDAEFFQMSLEGRDNKLFEVAFVFTLMESSVELLDRKTSEFVYKARDSGIEIISFYANQEMAYKLNKPFNIKSVANFTSNLLIGVKWHPMDLYSLSTIFAHTSSEFYHENGLVFGRNLLTGGHPVSFDIHDKSHKNQNIFFAGSSGYGKSSTIKKLMRLYSTIKDQKFVILDVENIKGRGEFSDVVDDLGGYIFEISPNSNKTLNPFEINEEEVYNVETDTYRRTLKLIEKIPYTSNIILSLISSERGREHSNIMNRIVNDTVLHLFRGIGLKENEPDTLYEQKNVVVDGKLINTQVKKVLPTLTDFFIEVVNRKLENTEPLYHVEYINLIAGLSNYVKEVHICEDGCGSVYSEKEKIQHEGICTCGKKIKSIYGAFNFFDGQTTSDVELNFDNYPIISVDVSSVPHEYLSKAMMIGINFILETLIKKNSENPLKAKKISFVNDEQHKAFKRQENRDNIIEAVRIVRKKNAGLWSITQSINDYTLYEEAKVIITQSDSAFVLKHKTADYNSLKTLLDNVNESDINFVINANIGELLLIDPSGKARVKVDLLPIEMNFANTNLDLEKERRSA